MEAPACSSLILQMPKRKQIFVFNSKKKFLAMVCLCISKLLLSFGYINNYLDYILNLVRPLIMPLIFIYNSNFRSTQQLKSGNGLGVSGSLANTMTGFNKTKSTGIGPKNDVWVKKWVDYSSKYGLGYLLSNGFVGVFFNDSTKIVLNSNTK